MRTRLLTAAALLTTGYLCGAFGYGLINVAQALKTVPLDVRFTFHTALMKVNGPVMQSTMALAALTSLLLAVYSTGLVRRWAATAFALEVTSFLITRFGNVPINGKIKQWAVGPVPSDYAQLLHRWELFHIARTTAALLAFLIIIAVAVSAQAPARQPVLVAPN
ncbi:DUF1772 domain-containing protein [Nocardia concava]|uniref:DUF1772 domain-containing protein n=1 Tax=Nocardia concava TaxID=257281 RepID=UPI0002F037CB|nr:DUF1772 domain-containing protein [Nocardia concava]